MASRTPRVWCNDASRFRSVAEAALRARRYVSARGRFEDARAALSEVVRDAMRVSRAVIEVESVRERVCNVAIVRSCAVMVGFVVADGTANLMVDVEPSEEVEVAARRLSRTRWVSRMEMSVCERGLEGLDESAVEKACAKVGSE